MRVLIIPEDFRKDQYILKPIVEAMMKKMSGPPSTVRVCQDPLMGGISQALNTNKLREVVERYKGMIDIFLLCVDRDGNPNRRARLDEIEKELQDELPSSILFLATEAWQELEVWVLAGHTLPKEWKWQDVRNEPHPKEKYFEPFALQRRVHNGPGGGRKTLATEAARRYSTLRSKCREDLAGLHNRLSNGTGEHNRI